MIDQYPSPNGVLTSLVWRKTAAGGETSLSGYDNANQALAYTPGQEQVYLNGILLVRGDDYTATNGTSITGLTALAASDYVQVVCYSNFSLASVPSTSISGTIANNQLANSSITINGNAISLGGSVSLPGDIESVTASTGLQGGGSSGAVTLSIDSTVTTLTGSQTLTNKDLTSGTNTFPTSLATLTGSQTLTNKTLTTPTITQGTATPTFSSDAYTLVAGDAGKVLLASNSSTAGTINIPTDATTNFDIGTQITILQTGSGQLTISATTPATTTLLSTGATAASPKCRAQYSAITILKTASNVWYALGDIS